jgi:hypothetical protein
MRADLLDAQAALDWANTQIPLLQQGFIEWQRANPYPVVEEPHPDGTSNAAVVYDQPFPLTFNAWVGAIINSLRSSLDLIAAALAVRNGHKPNADTHFPIFRCVLDFIDPLTGIESKKWLSDRERAAIKSFKPYGGGDAALWPLHHLDVMRKHQRLVVARPNVDGYLMVGARHMVVGGAKAIERLENKTVLFRLAPGERLNATQGNTLLAVFVSFNEATAGLADHEVAAVLRDFAVRVTDILFEIDRL